MCKKDNPQFLSNFQLDKEGKILSIFWSHISQQAEYIDFGDAVIFDTTYTTNLYDKPLGMFVGSNNHLHCTIFGFALLGDETVDTFKWFSMHSKHVWGLKDRVVMLTSIYIYMHYSNVAYIFQLMSIYFEMQHQAHECLIIIVLLNTLIYNYRSRPCNANCTTQGLSKYNPSSMSMVCAK